MTVNLLASGAKEGSRATKHLISYDYQEIVDADDLERTALCADEYFVKPKKGVFAVFDGVSDSFNPVQTAQLARGTLETLVKDFQQGQDIKEFILDASNKMHNIIVRAGSDPVTDGEGNITGWNYHDERGTTFAIAVVGEDALHIAHLGDSRIYFLYNTGDLEQVTKDDRGEEGQLVKCLGHKELNTLNEEDISYERRPLTQDGAPHVKKIGIFTDGITSTISDGDIKRILESNNPEDAVETLISTASSNPSDEKVNAYMRSHPNTPQDEAKKKLAGKDDMTAIVIEPIYETAAGEEGLRQENTRLKNEIADLQNRIRRYETGETAAAIEEGEPEPQVTVADMQTELTLEAIARNARGKTSELEPKYANYKVRRNHYENNRLLKVSDKMSFGKFLSTEYGKVETICSQIENAPQEYKTRCIGWCDKQLRHVDRWIRTVQNTVGPDCRDDISSYKASVENLKDHLVSEETLNRG